MKYWLISGETRQGPFSEVELREQWSSQAVSSDAQVQAEDGAEPIPLSQLMADAMAPAMEEPGAEAPGWPQTPEWQLAVTIAAELVKQAGLTVLPQFSDALVLSAGSQLLVLVPGTPQSLTREQGSAHLARWSACAINKEIPGVVNTQVVFCMTGPSPHLRPLRKARRVNFWGRGGYSDYVDTESVPSRLGSLASDLSAAIRQGVQSYQAGRIASQENLHRESGKAGEARAVLETRLATVKPWGTYAILSVCLAFFIATSVFGGSTDLLTLLRFGANFHPLTVENGQWWRLVGAMFLHVGLIHLLCNMFTLMMVGPRLEQIYGNAKYLALYAVSGVCGSLASVLSGSSVSAGASGALFGLCGAVVYLGWGYRNEWPPAFRRTLAQGMAPMIVYNLIQGFGKEGIDNAAHIGGLIGGFLFSVAVRPHALSQEEASGRHNGYLAIGLLPFAVLLLAVHHAVTVRSLSDYPTRVYTHPNGGAQLTLPALFSPLAVEKEELLAGPGMAVGLLTVPEPNLVEISNPVFTESLASAKGTSPVTQDKVKGRTWICRKLKTKDAAVHHAFAYYGDQMVKIETASAKEKPEVAEALSAMAQRSLKPKDHDPLLAGRELIQNGLYARGLEELAEVEETTEVKLLKATALCGLSRYEAARPLVESLVKSAPENRDFLSLQRSLLQDTEEWAAALKLNAKIEKLSMAGPPRNRQVARRVLALLRLGRREEAMALKAQLLATGDAETAAIVYNAQAWDLVLRGRFQEALPPAEKSVQASKGPGNLDTRGRAYLELGRLKEAGEDMDAVLQLRINAPYANYASGRVLEAGGENLELARLCYLRSIMLCGGKADFVRDAQQRADRLAK